MVGVAEGLDAEFGSHSFAALATFVVGRVDQLVFHYRVYQHQCVAVELEGEVFVLHRAAVKDASGSLFAEYGCELVHDAAVHAAVIVFGALTDFREFEFVDLVVVEQVVHGVCKAAFKSG